MSLRFMSNLFYLLMANKIRNHIRKMYQFFFRYLQSSGFILRKAINCPRCQPSNLLKVSLKYCLREVTKAIVNNLAARWITFPNEKELIDVRA